MKTQHPEGLIDAPVQDREREIVSGGARDTRGRLIEHALDCISRWGIEKVTLNDVARQAGVTRPTVYSYFKTRDDLIRNALMHSTYGFVEGVMQEIRRYTEPQERFLAGFMYVLEKLPHEPSLKFLTDSDMSQIMSQHAFRTPEATGLTRAMFREILCDQQTNDAEIDEIIEVSIRFLLSLLTIEGTIERDTEQMRQFLQRRLLPVVLTHQEG